MGKTTIQISDQTKAELDNLKKGDVESYDHTIQRIIRAYDGEADGLTESEVREMIREETA